MKLLRIYIPIILFTLPYFLCGQVGKPFVIPHHSAPSLEIQVGQSSRVSWRINTYKKYDEGFMPDQRLVGFSISATCRYRVDFSNTLFQDPSGNTIDLRNLGYRLEPAHPRVEARYMQWFRWGTKDGGNESSSLSGIYLGTLSPKTILKSGRKSNAGPHAKNSYVLCVGLGSQNIRNISSLPSLLSQGIVGGAYSTVLTLIAYPEP